MIDTNALINIGLALIANFTNVVPVPPDAVPTSAGQIARRVVGSRRDPTILYLVDTNGTEFWIKDGVVSDYRSPDTYFEHQDPSTLSQFAGESKLTTNQVVDLAISTLRRLLKRGDPLTNFVPNVIRGGGYGGEHVPFFLVELADIQKRPTIPPAARIEIDGRTGKIVRLRLLAPEFFDVAARKEIEKRIYTPDPVVERKPEPPHVTPDPPRPGTNELSIIMGNYLDFCGKLGVSAGTNANLDNLNWDETWYYPDYRMSPEAQACKVGFRDGSWIIAYKGVVCGLASSNACFGHHLFGRSNEQWMVFDGKILKHWQDLASDFEKLLTAKFGITRQALDAFIPVYEFPAPDFGTVGFKRQQIDWIARNLDSHSFEGQGVVTPPGISDYLETHSRDSKGRMVIPRMCAEFDLETGELELLRIYDLKMIEAIGKTQKPLK